VAEVAQKVVDDLGEHTGTSNSHADPVVDRLVTPPAPVRELVDAADAAALDALQTVREDGRPLQAHVRIVPDPI
jgi:hypothetical protein